MPVRPSVRPSNGSIDGAVRRDVEAAASPSSEGPSLSFPLFPNSFVSRRKRKYSSPQKKLAHVGKTAKSHVKSFSWLIGMVSSNNEGKKAKIDVLYILAKPCAPHQGLAGSLADVLAASSVTCRSVVRKTPRLNWIAPYESLHDATGATIREPQGKAHLLPLVPNSQDIIN